MVKLQKPIAKTIKKGAPGIKKPLTKKEKISSSKENVKQIKKTLEAVPGNDVLKQKNAVINKKTKKGLEKVKEAAPKLKSNVTQVQQTARNAVPKVSPALKEITKTAKKAVAKKNPIIAQVQKSAKKDTPSLKKLSENADKAVLKKKPVTKQKVRKDNSLDSEEQGLVEKLGQNNSVPKVEQKLSSATKAQKKAAVKGKNKIQNKADALKKIPKENLDKDVNTEKQEISPVFEPTIFDEDKFKDIVSLENIKKISNALKVLVEKQVSEKKASIFSDYKYFLNVASYKIPNCPKRMVKLNVKHALVDIKTDDVVMIVPDLQRGAKVDYEPTIQHYEDILHQNGVDNIKIMPFNQLRNEHSSYEAKIKLANTYDYFLCDGRIVGHVVGFCGKHFQKPRTTFHAVRLDNPKTIKSDIEHALKRTSYRQLQKGDMISIPVGNHLFTTSQLAENIKEVIEQLKTIFPGGYDNIRNIHIKIDIKGTSSLPLYVNLGGAPAEVPNVVGPREQRMINLKKQANSILSKFNMSKTGDLVKLNRSQIKRKQQIREAREAITLPENVEDDENQSEFKAPLKKKLKKQVKPQTNTEEESSGEE